MLYFKEPTLEWCQFRHCNKESNILGVRELVAIDL